MTATEEFILDWLKKADHDLQVARLLLASGEELYDSICFHTQQNAEKAIKALFTARNIEFPKTHNLLLLSNLLHDADISKFNEELERYWDDRGAVKMEGCKNNVPGVPHVCVKVPPAGGNTYLAANALRG